MMRHAEISECGKYRYYLSRMWESGLPMCGWIMLNPSTADAEVDDPTIRRCIGFAKRWDYGGIAVANLFAFRSTNPHALLTARDPEGPANAKYIEVVFAQVQIPVLAWGGMPNRALLDRVDKIVKRHDMSTRGCICLGRTAGGYQQPRHPLMLSYETERGFFR